MNQDTNIPNYLQIFFNRLEELEAQLHELRHSNQKTNTASKAEDQLLTVEEAAEFLSLSRSTIYQLKAADKIPFMQRGKRLYFTRENLMKWLEEESHSPNAKQQQAVQHFLKPRRKKLGGW